jgi:ATP-dependent RNA circularization protein (DNA/RNA ligase family)
MEFFRFPHTSHLAWLGQGQPRDDKVLAPGEARDLLSHDLVVEEKVDGANVGFSADEKGSLLVQNRGTFLAAGSCHPQFKPLWSWLRPREQSLADALFPDLMLFGEWCYATHAIRYSRLPDWLLAFDVFDRGGGRFWSTARRDELVARLGLIAVPRLGVGRFDLDGLQALLAQSRLGDVPAEGVYVRVDRGDWLDSRAKVVRPEFAQSIGEHWAHRKLEPNQLAAAVPGEHRSWQ